MKNFLTIPTEKRGTKEIAILKKCASFLKFFRMKALSDPTDKYKAQDLGCKYLKYVKFTKGQVLMKFHEMPKEFFICLKGTLSVLIPRSMDEIR